MRTIIVDDEPIMLKSFVRLSSDIRDINLVGRFESSNAALSWAVDNCVDLAFLDIFMPEMSGIELAKKLRKLYPSILIVFISAYDNYLRDANAIGADYYIVKPYKKETIEMAMERMRLLAQRQTRRIRVEMFNRFSVSVDGIGIPLSGKAKEILALICAQQGREISNEEAYSIVWDGRPYSNENMKVYYNAIRRLKSALAQANIPELLISATRGQIINTEMFECDFYEWIDGPRDNIDVMREKFLPGYEWSKEQFDILLGV